MKLLVKVMLVLILATDVASAMINGRLLTPKEQQQFRSVVLISITNSQGTSRGMALHTGNGVLLTAAHVVSSDASSIIEVNGLDKSRLTVLRRNTYLVKLAEKKEATMTANGEVQIPDLALIIPDENSRKILKMLPKLRLKTDATPFSRRGYVAIGWGKTDFDPLSVSFDVKIGEVEIAQQSDHFIRSSLWNSQSKFVALRAGDSGAPLISVRSDGSMEVVAVTSLSLTRKTANGFEAINDFARLDTDVALKLLNLSH